MHTDICATQNSNAGSSQDYELPPSNQLATQSQAQAQAQAQGQGRDREESPGLLGSYKDKSLDEILTEFTPFNTEESLGTPYSQETSRDAAFIQGISIYLAHIFNILLIIIMFYRRSYSTLSTNARHMGLDYVSNSTHNRIRINSVGRKITFNRTNRK